MSSRYGKIENDIRDTILEYLQRHRRVGAVWRDRQGVRKPTRGTFPESKGKSDIMGIFKTGIFFAIEVKKPSGVISLEQHNFLEAINKSGGVGIIAICLDDVRGHDEFRL